MKRPYILIFISLFLSLFIYLFYRTDSTVINEIFIFIFSKENYWQLKNFISENLRLTNNIIYSLPEGLWVFATTLASGTLFIPLKRKQINITFLPLLFAILLEFAQMIHLTNGTFDKVDIFFSIIFSLIGFLIVRHSSQFKESVKLINTDSFLCISTYLVVFFAHVSV